MREAATKLVGEHDFRNLCKMDVGNGVVNFIRNVESAIIKEISNKYDTSTCVLSLVNYNIRDDMVRRK